MDHLKSHQLRYVALMAARRDGTTTFPMILIIFAGFRFLDSSVCGWNQNFLFCLQTLTRLFNYPTVTWEYWTRKHSPFVFTAFLYRRLRFSRAHGRRTGRRYCVTVSSNCYVHISKHRSSGLCHVICDRQVRKYSQMLSTTQPFLPYCSRMALDTQKAVNGGIESARTECYGHFRQRQALRRFERDVQMASAYEAHTQSSAYVQRDEHPHGA